VGRYRTGGGTANSPRQASGRFRGMYPSPLRAGRLLHRAIEGPGHVETELSNATQEKELVNGPRQPRGAPLIAFKRPCSSHHCNMRGVTPVFFETWREVYSFCFATCETLSRGPSHPPRRALQPLDREASVMNGSSQASGPWERSHRDGANPAVSNKSPAEVYSGAFTGRQRCARDSFQTARPAPASTSRS
jgi:hypothetical protein